mmetsp:Transcript_22884/g.55533  ORF Transcript_22884/g.55533 Transcript_22884/m.55533 type:complete len:122 (-) Transcript_22884:3747-4112(-)
MLSLRAQMRKESHSPMYALSAVVVHHGASAQVGHYTAFTKTSGGTWYLKDDEFVQRSSQAVATNQQAYLLFYTACGSRDNQKLQRSHWASSNVTRTHPKALQPRIYLSSVDWNRETKIIRY